MKKSVVKNLVGGFVVATSLFLGGVVASAESKEVMITYNNEEGRQYVLDTSEKIKKDLKHLGAFIAVVDDEDIPSLQKHKDIEDVSENKGFTVQIPEKDLKGNAIKAGGSNFSEASSWNETNAWHIKYTHIESAWSKGFTGKGVKVAIMDTGIAKHPELTIKGGVSFVSTEKTYEDFDGHGTHVAGIVGAKRNGYGAVGIAPDAELYAVKVLDGNGRGTLFAVAEAMEWAIANDMDIVNLSLSSQVTLNVLEKVVKRAIAQDIVVVAAAGNRGAPTGENISSVSYPALFNDVIAVSSIHDSGTISSFSSRGPKVEVSAPGYSVYNTHLDNTYASMSGTSMASPVVAGLIAVLKEQYPHYTSEELRLELQKHVVDAGTPGRDNLYGYGTVRYDASKNATLFHPITNEPMSAVLASLEKAVSNAEKNKTRNNYAVAKDLLQNAMRTKDTAVYKERLDKMRSQSAVSSENAIQKLKQNLSLSQYQALVNGNKNLLDQEDVKAYTDQARVYEGMLEFRASFNLAQAKRTKSTHSINLAQKAINEVPDATMRGKLQTQLNNLKK